MPVAESRDFWEILRVRGGVKGQGSKCREDAWMGPQTGICPSPLGTQPEEPKRAQIGRSPSAKTQRELCPLSGLSKGVPSHPSSGHPWHPQLRGPACQCTHAYPTPENLCYKTGSSRCQPSPISSGPLQPGSRGGGEPPSLARPGWLFRGLPFGPWAEAFPGGPYLWPTAAGEGWGRGHSGLPGPQTLLSEASSLLGSFLSSKSCLPPNHRPLYKASGQMGSLFPDGLLWSRQRAGSLQQRPLPRGRRAPCTGGAQLAAGQHPRQNTAHSSLSRPGEPATLDARPYRRGCVPCPRRNRLCCQPLLVPGRAVSAAWAALELGWRRQGGTRTLATALVAGRRVDEILSLCGRDTEA